MTRRGVLLTALLAASTGFVPPGGAATSHPERIVQRRRHCAMKPKSISGWRAPAAPAMKLHFHTDSGTRKCLPGLHAGGSTARRCACGRRLRAEAGTLTCSGAVHDGRTQRRFQFRARPGFCRPHVADWDIAISMKKSYRPTRCFALGLTGSGPCSPPV